MARYIHPDQLGAIFNDASDHASELRGDKPDASGFRFERIDRAGGAPWNGGPARQSSRRDTMQRKPDPIELLRKSGFRRTFRDDVADFIWDCRVHPQLAAVCAGLGFLAGLLGVIIPAILIALVTK